MQTVLLGDEIKRRRRELGLTQRELGEGICEAVTISRLENNKQLPSYSCIKVLLQRLDLPDDRYFALLSKNESQIKSLREEIIPCNARRQNEAGLAYVRKLEKLAEPDDHITQQFILRSKVILGKPDGTAYTYSEKLEMLMRAIRLTVPRFELDHIKNFLYGKDEVKVINQIANVYSNGGEHEKAADIYNQLLAYIHHHFENLQHSEGLFPLVSFDYAHELCF
jgi:transcriptional regulator with XRE-family HTH domain